MSITSSEIVDDARQHDGRRWIRERHVDHTGEAHEISYLADAGFDAAAAMADRAVTIDDQLQQAEINANIAAILADGRDGPVSLRYSTADQNRAALRAAYQGATRQEAIMIGDTLAALTDTQLRNLFNMTAQQVTNLRANKLTPAANAATAIRTAAGQ